MLLLASASAVVVVFTVGHRREGIWCVEVTVGVCQHMVMCSEGAWVVVEVLTGGN
jgi:hypothetical protein